MNSKIESIILRKIASAKNISVAQSIGHDESFVSRLASGERGIKLCELEGLFNALGLKLIECNGDVVSMPKEEAEALRVLARKTLTN